MYVYMDMGSSESGSLRSRVIKTARYGKPGCEQAEDQIPLLALS